MERYHHQNLLALLAIVSFSTSMPINAEPAPLPEADSSIEYKSVADALAALRSKPGVVFTMENG